MIRRTNFGAPAALAAASPFGQRFGLIQASEAEARPEADVWMNIGYETGDENYPLVTLPYGIPIDTQKPLKVTGRDANFLAFTGARNHLLEQIQQMAADLKPGEDIIIGEGALVIQLRRRAGPSEAPDADHNPFIRDFSVRSVGEAEAA